MKILLFILIAFVILIFILMNTEQIDSKSDRIENDIKKKFKHFLEKFKLLYSGFSIEQKKWFSFLLGWTLLHFIFMIYAENVDGRKDYFWPIDRGSRLKYDYDFLELLTYVIIPFFIFFNYSFLNKKN